MSIPELAQQLTFEELLKDLLYAQAQYSEWSDVVKHHKSALEHKLESTKDDQRISRSTSDHEASGMQTTQLSINLGDYVLQRAQRVRRSFSEKQVLERVKLRENHISRELRDAHYASDAESTEGRQAIAIAEAKHKLIQEVLQDLQQAVSYTSYSVVEPKLQTKIVD